MPAKSEASISELQARYAELKQLEAKLLQENARQSVQTAQPKAPKKASVKRKAEEISVPEHAGSPAAAAVTETKPQGVKKQRKSKTKLVEQLADGTIRELPPKPKRAPSAWNIYVKENAAKYKQYPNAERFKRMREAYNASQGK